MRRSPPIAIPKHQPHAKHRPSAQTSAVHGWDVAGDEGIVLDTRVTLERISRLPVGRERSVRGGGGMAVRNAYVSGSPPVSRATLEGTIGKAAQFLFAVGRTPTVLNVLRKHGYTKQVHRRGHTLVEAASVRELDESAIDQEVDDALRTLDEWDDLNVGKIHAALTLFPDFRDEILEGVALGDSRAAVSNVEKILARIAEAEAASDRGKAVAARLAEIRVDASERRRLAGLVRIARGSKIFDRDVVEDDPA